MLTFFSLSLLVMSDQKTGDPAIASAAPVSENSTLVNNNGNSSASPSNNAQLSLSARSGDAAGLAGSLKSGEQAAAETTSTKGDTAAAAGGEKAKSADADGAGSTPGAVEGTTGTAEDQNGISPHNMDDHREEEDEEEDAAELDTVAANDVKNIILQVLSPYFDDDAGGAADVAGLDTLSVAANPPASRGAANKAGFNAGGAAAPAAASPPQGREEEEEEEAGEDVGQHYDHVESEMWIARICDGIMERLVGLGKPFKFVVHTMVMRKCGAGLHVCSSCYYAPTDGWLSHSHDLSAHLYAVVTVYWCAM